VEIHEFLALAKAEKPWDVAPMISLLGFYLVFVALFTITVGVKMATTFLFGGLLLALYYIFKKKFVDGFIEMWKHRPFWFHATLVIIESVVLCTIFWGGKIFALLKTKIKL